MVTTREDFALYRHPRFDFSLPVPHGWELLEDFRDDVAVAVIEPVALVGFRANAVVTVESVLDLDLDTWQTAADEQLTQQLPNYLLIDRENLEHDDRRLIRRLCHHVAADTGSVTMEQWAVMDGDTGYTLTTSVATLSYDSLADVFADMAAEFRVGPHQEAS